MISFDPSEIDRWADTPDANNQLPTLIRRLVMATVPTPELVDMPGGSSIFLSGWDGLTKVKSGNAWIPAGNTAWELSSQKNNIAGKASDDYNKRLADPLGVDAQDTTFVFVTPRRWSGKRDWVNARKGEKRWADVRALDADDLVAWLESSPSVAFWFGRLIGNLPASGFVCLDEWWENWASITNPPLTPELVTAGRAEQVNRVSEWIGGDASAYYLKADTKTEAIAFLAACAKTMDSPQGDALMARAVVVNTADAWRGLAASSTPLVLMRDFSEGIVSYQVEVGRGHHVLTPLSNSDEPRGDGCSLPRLGRYETVPALTEMGLSEQRAKALARNSSRSLTVMRRMLADEAGEPPPEWASLPNSHPIAALSLISQWEDNRDGDRAIVSEMTGQPYEQVERAITELAAMPDTPIAKVGNRWRFTSPEEAWHLLARKLTSSDIKRFGEIASEALGSISPEFDLPSEERFMAPVKGKVLNHSDTLRKGIARSLAVMGARPERVVNAGEATYTPSLVVSDVLGGNKGWRIWATLGNDLPTLAEAAPDRFLDSVERDLAAKPSPFSELFAQEGDVIFSGCPHAGLLWALERLAWSSERFSRVARALARLSELDPGGRAANRPALSLRSLFLPSIRFSEVSDEYRIETLEGILANIPDMGWKLLVGAYPNQFETVLLREPPDWQPWAQDGVPSLTRKEYYAFVGEVARLLLENVGRSATRWADMLEIIPRLSQDNRENAIDLLAQRVDALRQDPESENLWHELRKCLSKHRSFPDADWAMSSSDLESLDAAYQKLTPSDPRAAYSWLFSGGSALPEGESLENSEREKAIADAQNTAIKTAFDDGGMAAILEIARGAEFPDQVGFTLSETVGSADAVEVALQHLESPELNLVILARGALAGLYSRLGWKILDKALAEVKDIAANPESLAYIYLVAPAAPETWRRLEGEDQSVQDNYWRRLPAFRVEENGIEFAAQKLISVQRSHDAIKTTALSSMSQETIIQVLEAMPADLSIHFNEGRLRDLDVYNIARLFEILDLSDEVADKDIAQLEKPYIGIVNKHRPNMVLYRMVCEDPSLFADLISLAFKRANSIVDDEPLDAQAIQRARLAFEVIWELRQVPGLMEGGSVDSETLTTWVREARRLCRERDREDIGDQQIGQILANAPVGSDGVWPSEAVRDLLESLASPEIGIGFTIGKRKLRGVTSRGLFDGGTQERVLAENYRQDAAKISARWPFTASLLRDLADDYEGQARLHDSEAEWRDRSEAL